MKYTLTFLHQSMVIPTTRTLLNATGNNILSLWPFTTKGNVRKFMPLSISTALDHQDRTRENAPSTTPNPTTDDRRQELKTIKIYAINQPEVPSRKIDADQNGIFPIQSSSGNKYMMVIYVYNPNDVFIEPLRSEPRIPSSNHTKIILVTSLK